MRLAPLREKINKPVLVINDSPIKQFAENYHAVGQSALESVIRFTNRVTNGRRVTVIGYGACGMGISENFRNAHSVVSVIDTDPVTLLRANLDGFLTPDRDEAIASAVVDVSGRGYLVYDVGFKTSFVGGMGTRMVRHFFESLSSNAGITLHLEALGGDDHHICEALFKAFGVALRRSAVVEGVDVPSTKGVL